MKKSTLRALQGATLSIGAPLGWLVIKWLTGSNLVAELASNIPLYAYMLFATMMVFIFFGLYAGHKEDHILELSIIDSLTGIYNLRFYIERMQQEIAHSQRTASPLSLIYFDLDHFKNINDTYGHPFGDEVLKGICNAIKDDTRTNDVFARIGGEEFAILLPCCRLDDAKIDAERIRCLVENCEFISQDKVHVEVTISLGVATLKEDEDYKAFYKRADENLYQAKSQGRNRVYG